MTSKVNAELDATAPYKNSHTIQPNDSDDGFLNQRVWFESPNLGTATT